MAPFVHVDGRTAELAGEKNDCTVRSLSVVAGLPYGAAHRTMELAGRRPRKGIAITTVYPTGDTVKRIANYDVKEVFRSGFDKFYGFKTDITVAEALRRFPRGRFVFRTKHHVFAVIDGTIYDCNAPDGMRRRVSRVWQFTAV